MKLVEEKALIYIILQIHKIGSVLEDSITIPRSQGETFKEFYIKNKEFF